MIYKLISDIHSMFGIDSLIIYLIITVSAPLISGISVITYLYKYFTYKKTKHLVLSIILLSIFILIIRWLIKN